MGIFDSITGAQGRAQNAAPPQAPGVAECDRRLSELSGERGQLVYAIGEKYVAAHMEDKATGTPFEKEIAGILKLDEEAAIVEKRKLALQGLRKCTACGNILPLDSAFCNKCGEKLELLTVSESISGNVCPNCGAECEEGNAFCSVCGFKLVKE